MTQTESRINRLCQQAADRLTRSMTALAYESFVEGWNNRQIDPDLYATSADYRMLVRRDWAGWRIALTSGQRLKARGE